MSSVALTEQARRDATKKTTMRLKLSKVGGANLSRERITPWLGPLREACQQARRTTPASSDHCDSPDSRHAVFLLSESQLTRPRLQWLRQAPWGMSAGVSSTDRAFRTGISRWPRTQNLESGSLFRTASSSLTRSIMRTSQIRAPISRLRPSGGSPAPRRRGSCNSSPG